MEIPPKKALKDWSGVKVYPFEAPGDEKGASLPLTPPKTRSLGEIFFLLVCFEVGWF